MKKILGKILLAVTLFSHTGMAESVAPAVGIGIIRCSELVAIVDNTNERHDNNQSIEHARSWLYGYVYAVRQHGVSKQKQHEQMLDEATSLKNTIFQCRTHPELRVIEAFVASQE